MFSAFQDDENVIPVIIEIKKDISNIGNLYLVVSMEKIKRTSVTEGGAASKDALAAPDTDSTYRIHDIVENVNPSDERFLKNLPDQMLNDAQIEAKQLKKESKID